MNPDSPLTEQHLADINQQLANLELAQRQLNLAKSAGIDVTREQADKDAAEMRLRQIKNVYFPGR